MELKTRHVGASALAGLALLVAACGRGQDVQDVSQMHEQNVRIHASLIVDLLNENFQNYDCRMPEYKDTLAKSGVNRNVTYPLSAPQASIQLFESALKEAGERKGANVSLVKFMEEDGLAHYAVVYKPKK